MWKKFKESQVWHRHEDQPKKITFFSIFKRFLVLLCIWAVVFAWKYIVQYTKVAMWSLWQGTVKAVSKKLWEEMKRDDQWNVNILVVWVWWEKHQWWYLADTIIVASRNPELWAVSMLSIPRDLYVSWSWYAGRINWVFARGYSKGKTVQSWAEMLAEKMKQMLWIDIPYYVIADFQWFKDVVDTIWGIDIYVPESINDRTYPDSGIWYEPFYISVWEQHLDGETALKYARSRHTTSDFSRSQRQQEIIKAVIQKSLTKENLTSVSKLTELYNTYTEMVTTNISSKEIIGMVRYVYDFKKILSFGLNTHCTYSSYKLTDVWCFLYNGNREAFNGAAVIIPNGATAWHVSFYDYIQNFASFIFHDQKYLLENPRIVVKNAIDKSYASQKWKSPTWWANKLAVKMKKYWFNIVNTENSDEPLEQTTVIVYWQKYSNTINTLKKFLPINVVLTWQVLTVQWTWELLTGENSEIEYQEDLWYDMELLIWNDFIDYISTTPFSYEQ
jgi:LCP family protein required for cell wall assembly